MRETLASLLVTRVAALAYWLQPPRPLHGTPAVQPARVARRELHAGPTRPGRAPDHGSPLLRRNGRVMEEAVVRLASDPPPASLTALAPGDAPRIARQTRRPLDRAVAVAAVAV